MTETVCKTKSAAMDALEVIAGTMQRGTPRDALLAIKKWIDDNVQERFYSEELKAKLKRIFQGTDAEQKGREWIERETGDPAYTSGAAIKGDEGRYHHETIHEPEHGAELDCFWNSKTKAWEPSYAWPVVTRQTVAQ
jgi:hypothetical protein